MLDSLFSDNENEETDAEDSDTHTGGGEKADSGLLDFNFSDSGDDLF
ncbi:hypothetical protein [Desulfofarcimen acetoxidans]|jgi:hypothetical protein|nr:hypothetical protein [Desulfofarcimen acetoxidans]